MELNSNPVDRFDSKFRDNDDYTQTSKDITSAKDIFSSKQPIIFAQPVHYSNDIEQIHIKDRQDSNILISNLTMNSNQQQNNQEKLELSDESKQSDSDLEDISEVQDEEVKSKELPKSFFSNLKKNQNQPQYNSIDINAIRNLRGTNKYLYHRLVSLGYHDQQILALIQNLDIKSIEQAVEYLNKDSNGWHHPFLSQNKSFETSLCLLCGDNQHIHRDDNNDRYYQLWNQDNNEPLVKDLCGICYQQLSEEDLITLRCGHMYCEECLKQYITFQITNDKVQSLICPYQDCQNELSVQLMQRHLMPNEIYEKYIKFMKRQEIYRNPLIKGCPTADCEGYLKKPDSGLESTCDLCKKIYCFHCLHDPHEGITCEELIEKDYQEWAAPNVDVDICKNCGIRIEKEGGCPNMTCSKCKHEWCWICKEDFPVHNEQCPNYHQYLEILEFQGLHGELHPNGWFMYGRSGNACYWIFSFLFLLIIAMPVVIILNSLLSPCYILMMFVSCCHIRKERFKTWWGIILTIFLLIILYAGIPVVFFVVTIPQIAIFVCKKVLELKDLMKNKCRRYRKLDVTPIMNRFLASIGMR